MTSPPPSASPPPLPDPEARLTALLLGELSPEETAAVQAELAARPEQIELLTRLARTLPLVREALRTPLDHPTLSAIPTRLAPERRRSLLAAFQKVTPLPGLTGPARPARRLRPWLALAALFVVLLVAAGLLLPSLTRAKAKGQYLTQLQRQRAADMEQLAQGPNQGMLSPAAVPAAPAPMAASADAAGRGERTDSLERTPVPPEATSRSLVSGRGALTGPAPAAPVVVNQAGDPTAANGMRMLRRIPAPGRAPSEEAGAPGAARAARRAAAPELGDRSQLGQVFEPTPVKPAPALAAGLTADSPQEAPPPPKLMFRYGKALPPAPPVEGSVRVQERAEAAAAAAGPGGGLGGLGEGQILEKNRLMAGAVAGVGAKQKEKAPVLDQKLSIEPAAAVRVHGPEVATAEEPFSTFSLNVSDVSFRLAAASLEAGRLPEPGSVRVEEFLNAFDYHDPAPRPGAPVAFYWERARHPFAHNRELVRVSLQTAAAGREAGRALNLVVVLDRSGSMERADRVATSREMLRVLAAQLTPADRLSVVTFARTARLYAEGVPGDQAGPVLEAAAALTPEGGTHLEDALRLGYTLAARHFLPGGVNRVILITDGAANLGDRMPESLQQLVEDHRRRGLALDCFGVGWEEYNDQLLELLARHGDGRYGFLNAPEEAAGFAARLAGALQVAARDVKVQVEFNPTRVTRWRLIGYAKDLLTAEQFRDDTVDAAELGAAEAGNALYALEVNAQGAGPLGVLRVRYREPASGRYRELAWTLDYPGSAPELAQAGPALRLAAVAALFGEWLAQSPHAAEITPSRLLPLLEGVPENFAPDPRPAQLVRMLEQARQLAGL